MNRVLCLTAEEKNGLSLRVNTVYYFKIVECQTSKFMPRYCGCETGLECVVRSGITGMQTNILTILY